MNFRIPAAIALVCLTSSAFARPPGKTLTGQVKDAYADLDTYRATLTFGVDTKSGRVTNIQRNEIYLAFDRGDGGDESDTRVLVDTPGFRAVVKDQTLFASMAGMPGRHVEQPLDTAVNYDTLTQTLVTVQGQALLIDPMQIDLAFALSNNPIATISQDAVNSATPIGPDPDDPLLRPRLEFGVQGGKATLTIDPKSKLVVAGVIEMSPRMLPEGDHTRFTYEYEIESINETLPDDTFDFDTSQTQSAPSLAVMQSGGAGPMQHPLVGQTAPGMTRQTMDDTTVDLSQVEEPIVVLELWATWAPDCVTNLQSVQTVADWANSEGKPVAFFAVNLGEGPAAIQDYFEQHGLTLPVLLDPDGQASLDYGAQGIPQTVVIKDDIIREVYVNGTEAEALQADLERLIEE